MDRRRSKGERRCAGAAGWQGSLLAGSSKTKMGTLDWIGLGWVDIDDRYLHTGCTPGTDSPDKVPLYVLENLRTHTVGADLWGIGRNMA